MREPLWTRQALLAVAAITLTGAAVRFIAIGHQSFWIDEIITVELVEKPFTGMLRAIPGSESTPPLYYVLAWLWSRLAGADEAGLRSLSAVLGALTIPVCFAAARTLVSTRAGLIAAALAAVSPLLVWYSQEARAYALFVVLGALSFLFFARSLERPTERNLGLWAVASSLTILTHYFGLFLVVAEGAILLYHRRSRPTWLASGAIATVGLALLPLAVYQVVYSSSRWIRFVELSSRIEDAVRQLLVPSPPTIWAGAGVEEGYAGWWWSAGIVLIAAALVAVAILGARDERRGATIAFLVGGATVAVPVLMSLAAAVVTDGRGDVFLYRNVIVAWLPFAVVVAAALGARRTGRVGVALASLLVAWSLAVVVHNATTPERQRDDWRLVAEALGPSAGQVVVLSPSWKIAALEHHVGDIRELGAGTATREIELLTRRAVPSYSPAVENLELPAGFERVETRELQNWVLTRYRADRPVYVTVADLGVASADASFVPLVRER